MNTRIDRPRALAGVVLAALAAAVAGCGGHGSSNPIPAATLAPVSTVKFTVTVPVSSASAATRKPLFDAPSGTQSVSFQLTSVDGKTQTSTPTVANVGSDGGNCSTSNNVRSCTVSVPGVAGSDLFTVTSYPQADAKGTPIATGTVQVTTTAGTTTTAPVTLSGTIASIALSLPGVAVPGVSTTLPVVIIAKDANGATIMGTYSNPITLANSDTSGATKLSVATLNDSTTASGVTLSYDGSKVTATISATASGVASSNIKSATLTPSGDFPVANGAALNYNVTLSETWSNTLSTPSPAATASGTEVDTYTTGASFNNVSNLIKVNRTQTSTTGFFGTASNDFYYSLNQTSTGATINEVGWVYLPSEGSAESDQSVATGGPGWELVQLPFKSGNAWDSGSSYKETYTYATTVPVPSGTSAPAASTAIYNGNKDGSYVDTYKLASNDGTVTSYNETVTVAPNGTGTDVYTNSNGTDTVAIGTPVPAPSGTPGYVIPVTHTWVDASPSPGASPLPTSTPEVYSVPDWYPGGAQPPSPLQSDAGTDKGSVAIPAQCNLPTTIATNAEQIEDVYSGLDPFGWSEKRTTDYYYAQGVGLVCMIEHDAYTDTNIYYADSIPRTYTFDGVQTLSTQALQAALRQTQSLSQAGAVAGFGLRNIATQERAEHHKRFEQFRATARVKMTFAHRRH